MKQPRISPIEVLFIGAALALGVSQVKAADEWTVPDTALQVAVTAALFVDERQTVDIARHPDCYETNSMLGRHPSPERARNYFVAAALADAAISYALPRQYRGAFQASSLALELVVIGRNKHLGLSAKF